jgi:hypothetical protein
MIQSVHIDTNVAKVLDVAAAVGYGEIYEVDLRPSAVSVLRMVSDGQQRFLELVSRQCLTYVSKLIIHNGEPAVVEIDGSIDGMKFRRKLKI